MHSPKDGQLGGDSARDKDTPMPSSLLPSSPSATENETETETETETNTDLESPSMSSPLSATYTPELSKINPHDVTPIEESTPANFGPGHGEPTLRPDTATSADDNTSLQSSITSPVTSPPYWTARSSQNGSPFFWPTARASANVSVESLISVGRRRITLQDNESSGADDRRGVACWAKSVEVPSYVVVNGGATSIGAFVVWNIRVERLDGGFMDIRKRYSEFDDFRWRLMRTFPGFEAAVPELPPKSLISKFRPKFLEKRRAGLQYFLQCILLNPEFSGSPILQEFLFARQQ